MRGSAVRPRHDQVGELTRGVRLPLAAITEDHLQVLADGLRQAFDDVRVHEPATVGTGEEPEVTALMQARLNGLIHEDSLWRQLVLWVGGERRASVSTGLTARNAQTSRLCCQAQSGAFPWSRRRRFSTPRCRRRQRCIVRTGFAASWRASTRGATAKHFMIGYVRDGSSIDTTLKAFLSKAVDLHPHRYLVEALPVPVGSGSSAWRIRGMAGTSFTAASDRQTAPGRFGLAFVAGVGPRPAVVLTC